MNIDELLKINSEKLEEARKEADSEKILVHEKIASILETDPAIFFKIDMESALKILVQLLPEDKIKEAYTNLMSPESFENLRRNFKI